MKDRASNYGESRAQHEGRQELAYLHELGSMIGQQEVPRSS